APRGRHSAKMGTANHTIMLAADYFELLGVLEPTEMSRKWLQVLEAREGLSAVALRTDDAAAAAAELQAVGIAAGEAVSFARPVDMPDGSRSEAAFVTTYLPDEAAPPLWLFCCQHLSRHITWASALLRHENTAYAIDHLAVVTASPAVDAAPA